MTEQLPVWNAVGIEPSIDLKVNGWQPGMKPSAQHFNWLFNRAYKCLEDLQNNKADNTALINLSQTISTLEQNFNEHLAETVFQKGGVHGLEIENGTFTPHLYGSLVAGNHVYSTQKGFYEKIGNRVFIQLWIQINRGNFDANMDGEIRIGGLPFVNENIGYYTCPCTCSRREGVKIDTVPIFTAEIAQGQTYISLKKGSTMNISATDFDINSDTITIVLSATYKTV